MGVVGIGAREKLPSRRRFPATTPRENKQESGDRAADSTTLIWRRLIAARINPASGRQRGTDSSLRERHEAFAPRIPKIGRAGLRVGPAGYTIS